MHSGTEQWITSGRDLWRSPAFPGVASTIALAVVVMGLFVLENTAQRSPMPRLETVGLDDRADSGPLAIAPASPQRLKTRASTETAPIGELLEGFVTADNLSSTPSSTSVVERVVESPAEIVAANPGEGAEGGPNVEPTAGPPVSPVTTTSRATTTSTITSTTSAPPADLRRRVPISAERFETFVRNRGFDEVNRVAPGVVHGRYVESDQKVNVLLVHRSSGARLAVSPASRGPAPVGGWASEIGAVAAVNGNWFGPFDGPAVSNGRTYGGADHGYTALFGFTAGGDLITDHHRVVQKSVDRRVVEGVAGHPTLILDRKVTTDFGSDPTFSNRQPRTAIGVTGSIDVLILVTVDGRRSNAAGMTGSETAQLMKRLQAHHAVMLDGGGSSAMWVAGSGIVNRQSDPGRWVGNQIAVLGGRG